MTTSATSPPCQAALPFVRHLLELLSSCEVLGLRQLALGGITFQVLGLRGEGGHGLGLWV